LPTNTRSGEAFGVPRCLVEGGDRFARRRQALLVGVGVGFGDVVGDGALQMLRRAESEGARVADVQLDQLPALAFQFAGAAGEFAADLVADFGQALAGLQGGGGWRGTSVVGGWKKVPQSLAEIAPLRFPGPGPFERYPGTSAMAGHTAGTGP
jgi:hypothetical protein